MATTQMHERRQQGARFVAVHQTSLASLIALVIVVNVALTVHVLAQAGESPDFQIEVVPLLKKHCVTCHGPAKQEFKLNLATPAGVRRGGEKGPVIVAGKPDESRLWQLVADDEMPVDKPLPPRAKEILRRWILDGASGLPASVSSEPNGDEHWAFQKLPDATSMIPEPKDSSRIRTPIDRFIQVRLEKSGVTIGPEADRETLIRRVSFDLTGLPPTPEERQAFLDDRGDGAYERMLDRYLESERYGERWGKYWLDAAGYADSNGYFGADTDRPLAFRYRDYVIRSLNADKPWDQFIREQIAGDEIAGYDPATGVQQETLPLLEAVHFLRNSPDGTDSSDGNPDEVRRDKYAALEGTLEIIGSSLFGLTVGCARCHDHKFEPFTQRDYYQLQAVIYPAFNVSKWIKPKDRLIRAASAEAMAAWRNEIQRIDAEIASHREGFRKWLKENGEPTETLFFDEFDGDNRKLAGTWSNTVPSDKSPAGTPAVALDSSTAPGAVIEDSRLQIIESGASGDRVCCTVESFDWTPALKGDWIQATFDLHARGAPAPYVGYFVALRDFNDADEYLGGNILIDGRQSGQAAIHVDYPGEDSMSRGTIGTSGYEPGRNLGVRITNVGQGKFEISQVSDGFVEPGSVTLLVVDLPNGAFGFEYCCNRSFSIDNVRIERSQSKEPGKVPASGSTNIDEIRQQIAAQRKQFNEQLDRLTSSRPAEPGKLAVVADYSHEFPVVPLLIRGEHKNAGESVPGAAPHVLADAHNPVDLDRVAAARASTKGTGRRLAFAEWLTCSDSRAAGLLARVTVNRWWSYHFSRGLAGTPENLGYSGAAPTHPELLDYLAARLVEQDWKPKSIHRMILRSAVYRQASTNDRKKWNDGPDNRLLWCFPMRRLDAEAIRDGMLAASGQLDVQMFGPYVPIENSPDGQIIVKRNATGKWRRSVYLQQRRTQTPDFLRVFDAPSIVVSCTGRPRTTVPLQSLNLMNSQFVRSCAQALADRVQDEGELTDQEFARQTFIVTVGREPRPAEAKASLKFLKQQPAEYSGVKDAVRRARTDFCQMVLVSNTFLYVE